MQGRGWVECGTSTTEFSGTVEHFLVHVFGRFSKYPVIFIMSDSRLPVYPEVLGAAKTLETQSTAGYGTVRYGSVRFPTPSTFASSAALAAKAPGILRPTRSRILCMMPVW